MASIVNTRKLNAKSKLHRVTQVSKDMWEVLSGTSNDTYTVTRYGQTFRCTCNWGLYHRNSACSHVMSVVRTLAPGGYNVSYVKGDEAVERAHRRAAAIGDDVYAMLRRVAA